MSSACQQAFALQRFKFVSDQGVTLVNRLAALKGHASSGSLRCPHKQSVRRGKSIQIKSYLRCSARITIFMSITCPQIECAQVKTVLPGMATG